ncbi:hypothetical protein B0O41_0612 [Propionibacteriaceae bacterium ES.041]|uniref:hypothetical protein n=1 Tax=Enemella evansiae TaxID=2016499 RepID=UPI000C01E47D|nr:hypothetical protein [Enemella evansiae]PFG65839.1 hypothetical protein B0O41_0612 [Propionibacteriaceae bacterium ES.041]
MRTSLCLSVAALLTIGLSACGGSGDTSSPAPAPAPASQAPASQAPASSAPASSPARPSSAPAPSTAGSGENSGAGGADTPEAAAEAMLKGAGNKDAQAICDVMSIQGKPVNVGGTGPACTQQWTTTLQSTGGSLDSLKNAKVSNVQISGDKADLKNATVTPAEGKAMLAMASQAVKIDGRWYLALGAA